MDRLYLVVCADLSRAQQAVQAAHALSEFAEQHPAEHLRWRAASNTLALLSVPNETALHRLIVESVGQGWRASPFREPDAGGRLTAVALEPAARRLCHRLPLALSEAVP